MESIEIEGHHDPPLWRNRWSYFCAAHTHTHTRMTISPRCVNTWRPHTHPGCIPLLFCLRSPISTAHLCFVLCYFAESVWLQVGDACNIAGVWIQPLKVDECAQKTCSRCSTTRSSQQLIAGTGKVTVGWILKCVPFKTDFPADTPGILNHSNDSKRPLEEEFYEAVINICCHYAGHHAV